MQVQRGLATAVTVAVLSAIASEAIAESNVMKVVNRGRRKIAIGPVAGGGVIIGSDGVDGTVTFGLALFTYKDCVLEPSCWKDLVKERVKERVKQLLKGDIEATEDLRKALADPNQLEALVRTEIEAELNRKFDKTPKPGIHLGLEGIYTLRGPGWGGRLFIGIGLGPVSATIHSTFVRNDGNNTFAVGPEIGFHILPTLSVRSPVIELFVRGDLSVSGDPHTATIGARLLLDIL
jgi:hypothetical protein